MLTEEQRHMLAGKLGGAVRAFSALAVAYAVAHHWIPGTGFLAGWLGDQLTTELAAGITAGLMFAWSWANKNRDRNRLIAAVTSDPKVAPTLEAFLADFNASTSSATSSRAAQSGFAFIIIPIIIGAAFLVASVAKVHVPLLTPHTKITAAKADRLAFTAVKAFQDAEEDAWHSKQFPALAVIGDYGPDGRRTLHSEINVKVLAAYKLIDKVRAAVLALPTGGTLSLADLGLVRQLEEIVADLVSLARPTLGSALAAAIEQVSNQIASFNAQAQAVKQ